MGELINLRQIKKRNDRADAAREADANRRKFGRSKAEREIQGAQAKRASKILDQTRIDRGDRS